MAKASSKPLQPNPFTTYRDPETGLWVVVKSTISSKSSDACPIEPENEHHFKDEVKS